MSGVTLNNLFRAFGFVCLFALSLGQAQAFNLTGAAWPEGRVTFNVNFAESDPAFASQLDYQGAFEAAMQEWNDNSTFEFDIDTSAAVDPCTQSQGSILNGVRFSDTSCGTAFGAATLAVARTSSNGSGDAVRTGIVFDSTENWDIYDGPRTGRPDFQRVAVHELGHSLGLAHQSGIPAIMAPAISNLSTIQADDIAGAASLYDLDGDGVKRAFDNCRDVINAGQENVDGDDFGDACDSDIDNDGVLNDVGVDQQFNLNNASNARFGFGGSERFSHTFTSGITGNLVALRLPVDCNAGDLKIAITGTAGGFADDNDEKLAVTLTTGLDSSPSDFATVILNDDNDANLNGYQTTAGETLAITIESNVGCAWSLAPSGSYTGGVSAASNNFGPWFIFNGGVDLPFATLVDPTVKDNCPFVSNADQLDADGDGVGNLCENDDQDFDLILDGDDNCPSIPNNDQADFDGDDIGDVCDADIDDDGALNAVDSNDLNGNICSDNDNDLCDDCSSGMFNESGDGLDFDSDGFCDIGDADIDGDGALNAVDSNDFNSNVCSDNDNDQCDDCSSGTFNVADDGLDTDLDGFCNLGDADIDGDGALNAVDSNDLNANVCSDNDNDQCDDCSSGTFNVNDDGLDTDSDGFCDVSDADIDGDGVLNAVDSDEFNANICSDNDNDQCDDCSSGTFNVNDDGLDTDSDGFCDVSDVDIDGDGVLNAVDSDELNANVCSDNDNDQCDDCSSGMFNVADDGLDTDLDGFCNLGDADIDGDGALNAVDSDDLNPNICSDNDNDQCNDCSSGTFNVAGDGLDTDLDGFCNLGDADIDGDGALNAVDSDDLNANVCSDNDNDQCDDCNSGTFNVNDDGLDTDSDGFCDVSDVDIDGDGVLNAVDSDQLNANVCSDNDNDQCDDCSSGTFNVNEDGLDTDSDGFCDVSDVDIDGDGVLNAVDSDELNANVCSDNDNDQCDDCSSGTFNVADDGLDTDLDGFCDLGDADIDGDGALNAVDSDDLNPNICSDIDNDRCDDCSSGAFNVADDGLDSDGDGLCDLLDLNQDGDDHLDADDNCPAIINNDQADLDNDDIGDLCDSDIDGDSILNALDSDPRNVNVCSDDDNDQCDDCSSGAFNIADDGLDTDSDGLCDLGDANQDGDSRDNAVDNCPLIANDDQADFDDDEIGDLCDSDADNDQVQTGIDSDDLNPLMCSDNDNDLCDDCSSGSFDIANDGLDTDANGICNLGDEDDDGDAIPDELDNCSVVQNLNQLDSNGDGTGDACSVTIEDEQICIPVASNNGRIAVICL